METKQPNPMTLFDEITIPKQFRFFKLLLPFMPSSSQRILGILIKFMELQNTIQLIQTNKNIIFNNNLSHPEDIFEQLFPYLSSEEMETANSFRSMMNLMDLMQMFSTSDINGSDNSSFDPVNLMSGILSPEQLELFESYQSMFTNIQNCDQ